MFCLFFRFIILALFCLAVMGNVKAAIATTITIIRNKAFIDNNLWVNKNIVIVDLKHKIPVGIGHAVECQDNFREIGFFFL